MFQSLVFYSVLQELRGMLNKQIRVLVLRAMIPVGVNNELRIRQALLEDERIHCIDDHVVAAVHHERRLRDLLQISIGIFRRSTPFLQCRYLRRSNLLICQWITIVFARPLPFQIFPSRRLAPRRWRKEDTKPKLVRRIVAGSEDLLRLGSERRHPLATPWARAHEDKLSDKIWPVAGELLCTKAAHRESESVEFFNAKGAGEGGCVPRHLFNRG